MTLQDNEYAAPGRARRPAEWSANIPVCAVTPKPLLVGEVTSPTILLAGAWTFTMRKVLKLKVTSAHSRLAYAVSKAALNATLSALAEKEIPPAAWVAWVATKRAPFASAPVPMATILGAEWIKEGRFRGWFRKETLGLFGGKLVVLGDPPPQGSDPFAVDAYQGWARVEKARREAAWHEASLRGSLFPNVDMDYLREKR